MAERHRRGGENPQGFAAMSPEKQREAAAKGGRAVHEKGTGHEWKKGEQATRDAGRKGGQVSRGGRGKVMPASPQILPTPESGVPSGTPPILPIEYMMGGAVIPHEMRDPDEA